MRSMVAGSATKRLRTLKACLVASTSACKYGAPSASWMPWRKRKRSKMARIIKEAKPCVGGVMLYSVAPVTRTLSGVTLLALCACKSARRSGPPRRSCSAAMAAATLPR